MKKTMVKMLVVAGLFLSMQSAFPNGKAKLDGPTPTPACSPATPNCPILK